MDFKLLTLDNGIRVIHRENKREVAHCGLVINAGSRDELGNEHGLAHFIEHCLFKGTKKRKTFHILSRLDMVGAEINAYTTKEETWIYASFINQHFDRAVELIADIAFNSTFPTREINKEKAVIVDEINAYLDSPSEQIFDDFEELIYGDHPLGKNILGTVNSVNDLNRNSILDFTERRYKAEDMVFSVVGNIPFKKVERIAKKYLGHLKSSGKGAERQNFSNYQSRDLELKRDAYQVHYMLGTEAYGHGDKKKTGLILLNNILGGPAMNSRLNLSVREKHGIAYNIESHYQAYSDTGIFQIYLGTDKKSFAKSKRLVLAELKKLREKKLGVAQLHNAKQQLAGQIALAQDSESGTMIALGKSLLLYNRVDSIEEVFRRIDELDATLLLEIANEVLDPKRLSSLTFLN